MNISVLSYDVAYTESDIQTVNLASRNDIKATLKIGILSNHVYGVIGIVTSVERLR